MTAGQKYKALVNYRLECPYTGDDMHKHHVIPRCMNPKKNLIVQLSLEEHTFAHYWLWHMFNARHDKLVAQYNYAAYKGLRNQWFISRYRCTRDKEFAYYERVYSQTICDSLRSSGTHDMKFDCIIMNPPYQRNLHLKILAEAIKHLKDDGTCVNLSPIRWLQDPLREEKKNSDYNKFKVSVAEHIESISMIAANEAQTVFNAGFWNGLGIYVCKTNCFDFYKDYAKNSMPDVWTLVKKVGLPLFNGTLEVYRVYDMYSKNTNYPYWIKCSRVHGHTGQKDEYDCITPKKELVFNVKGNEGREVYFKTEIEANNFFKTMNSMFYKFLKKLGCWPTDDFNKGLPWLGDAINPRTGLKGYEGEWTDDDLYKFFNITSEEQKIIEETMEKYAAK